MMYACVGWCGNQLHQRKWSSLNVNEKHNNEHSREACDGEAVICSSSV